MKFQQLGIDFGGFHGITYSRNYVHYTTARISAATDAECLQTCGKKFVLISCLFMFSYLADIHVFQIWLLKNAIV